MNPKENEYYSNLKVLHVQLGSSSSPVERALLHSRRFYFYFFDKHIQ